MYYAHKLWYGSQTVEFKGAIKVDKLEKMALSFVTWRKRIGLRSNEGELENNEVLLGRHYILGLIAGNNGIDPVFFCGDGLPNGFARPCDGAAEEGGSRNKIILAGICAARRAGNALERNTAKHCGIVAGNTI